MGTIRDEVISPDFASTFKPGNVQSVPVGDTYTPYVAMPVEKLAATLLEASGIMRQRENDAEDAGYQRGVLDTQNSWNKTLSAAKSKEYKRGFQNGQNHNIGHSRRRTSLSKEELAVLAFQLYLDTHRFVSGVSKEVVWNQDQELRNRYLRAVEKYSLTDEAYALGRKDGFEEVCTDVEQREKKQFEGGRAQGIIEGREADRDRREKMHKEGYDFGFAEGMKAARAEKAGAAPGQETPATRRVAGPYTGESAAPAPLVGGGKNEQETPSYAAQRPDDEQHFTKGTFITYLGKTYELGTDVVVRPRGGGKTAEALRWAAIMNAGNPTMSKEEWDKALLALSALSEKYGAKLRSVGTPGPVGMTGKRVCGTGKERIVTEVNGKPVDDTPLTPKGEADALEELYKDRVAKYGDPQYNMQAAADVMRAILSNYWQMELPPIDARIMALVNIGIKLTRAAHAGEHEPDTLLDIKGYIRLHDELDLRQ